MVGLAPIVESRVDQGAARIAHKLDALSVAVR
jgi:hypothetical protein